MAALWVQGELARERLLEGDGNFHDREGEHLEGRPHTVENLSTMDVLDERPEAMAAFFDRRVDGYDAHMRESVEDFDAFYHALAAVVKPTHAPIRVLDLGAGTGAQLDGIFARAPRARVTAVDVSPKMLELLGRRHARYARQIETVQASFTDLSFGKGAYDYVVSAMALHHHLPEAKVVLYRRICAALRSGGVFGNGDYTSDGTGTEEAEASLRALGASERHPPGGYHVDLPLSVDEEKRLLTSAGFIDVTIPFLRPRAAVLVARR